MSICRTTILYSTMASASDVSQRDIFKYQELCRTQFNDSRSKIAQRFITDGYAFSIKGTSTNVQDLTDAISHWSFSFGSAHSNELVIRKPLAGDMPYKGHTLPSAKHIDRLLGAMPYLKALTLGSDDSDGDSDPDGNGDRDEDGDAEENAILNKSREDLAPRLLRGMLQLHPVGSLSSLTIHNSLIPGETLVKILATFKTTLLRVDLSAVQLGEVAKKTTSWETIFRILVELNLEYLHVADLPEPGTSECKVLSDVPIEEDSHGHQCQTGKEPWADMSQVRDGGALCSRCTASYWRSYVKKGLRKLLGLQDFPTYWRDLGTEL